MNGYYTSTRATTRIFSRAVTVRYGTVGRRGLPGIGRDRTVGADDASQVSGRCAPERSCSPSGPATRRRVLRRVLFSRKRQLRAGSEVKHHLFISPYLTHFVIRNIYAVINLRKAFPEVLH